jgi:hypothetical protein
LAGAVDGYDRCARSAYRIRAFGGLSFLQVRAYIPGGHYFLTAKMMTPIKTTAPKIQGT